MYESSVERPSCNEASGVGDLPPCEVTIWFAMAWSIEMELLAFIGPFALTPVQAVAQLLLFDGST